MEDARQRALTEIAAIALLLEGVLQHYIFDRSLVAKKKKWRQGKVKGIIVQVASR